MASKAFARMTTKKRIRSMGAYRHNHRLIKNDKDVVSELSKNNISKTYTDKTYRQIELEFEKLYKEKNGKKAHSESMPLREIVLLVKENSKVEDIEKFIKEVEKETGFKCLDLNWHKDEGHYKKGDFKINQHCHIMFESFDRETGKPIRPPLGFTEKLQDLASYIMGMERGQSKKETNRVHLEPAQYKQHIKEIEKINDLKNSSMDYLERQHTKKLLEIEALKKQLKGFANLETENKQLKTELNETNKSYNNLHNKMGELNELFESLGLTDINVIATDTKDIKKKLQDKLEETYKKARDELKASGMATQQDYSNLKQEKEHKNEVLKSVFNKHLKNKEQLTIG